MTGPCASAAPLSALHDMHRRLEGLMALHQEALVVGDLGLARRAFALYRSGLRLHIRQEDEWLLPRFRCFEAGYPWNARVYDGEHRKLERHLRRCGAAVVAFCRRPTRHGLIDLLELQKTLKHLSDHHHQREEESLFPALRENMDAADLTDVVVEMERQWRRTPAGNARLTARLTGRLHRRRLPWE